MLLYKTYFRYRAEVLDVNAWGRLTSAPGSEGPTKEDEGHRKVHRNRL